MEDIYDKFNITILYEEEKINKLLKNIRFKMPEINFKNYIKKERNIKTKNNINNISDSLYNLIRDNKLDNQLLNIIEGKKNKYSDIINDVESQIKNNLNNFKEKDNNLLKKHILDYKKQINIFKRNCLIIKTFIFKGYSFGQFNKPSLLNIYINIEIIKNLKLNKNEKIIRKEALEKYLREKKNLNKIFNKLKILHDTFYQDLIKFKSNNNIKSFVQQKIQKFKKIKKALPPKNDLIKECKDFLLNENFTIVNENKYEFEYTYYLLDVYEYIHLIKPNIPDNYYLLFFYKNYDKIKFKDAESLINLYNRQSIEEREKIELFNYRLLR